SATNSNVTGYYLIDFPGFKDVEDSGANQYQCTYYSYGGAHTLGQNAAQQRGDITETDCYTTCGGTPSGKLATTYGYSGGGAPYGNLWTMVDPAGHITPGCAVNAQHYTECSAWDTVFGALTISHANALNQTSFANYQGQPGQTAVSAGGGWGLWPVSSLN